MHTPRTTHTLELNGKVWHVSWWKKSIAFVDSTCICFVCPLTHDNSDFFPFLYLSPTSFVRHLSRALQALHWTASRRKMTRTSKWNRRHVRRIQNFIWTTDSTEEKCSRHICRFCSCASRSCMLTTHLLGFGEQQPVHTSAWPTSK